MNITLYTKPHGGPTRIELKAELVVIRPYAGVDVITQNEWIEDNVHLIVTETAESFWPVIMKLSDKEASELAKALEKAVKHKHQHKEQLIEEIKNEPE